MMYFVKNTDKGIVVVNQKIATKEVTFKNGIKRTISTQVSDLKFGFFAVENPSELGYEKGEKVPVVLSESCIEGSLYWCNPE